MVSEAQIRDSDKQTGKIATSAEYSEDTPLFHRGSPVLAAGIEEDQYRELALQTLARH